VPIAAVASLSSRATSSSATATASWLYSRIVDAVAEETLATTLYDEFAEEEVARGRPLAGLFPAAGPEAKRDFETWKQARAQRAPAPITTR